MFEKVSVDLVFADMVTPGYFYESVSNTAVKSLDNDYLLKDENVKISNFKSKDCIHSYLTI